MSSAVSKKYANFVKGFRDKPATTLPGVGPVAGERLRRKGIYTADDLLDKYKDLTSYKRSAFMEWMMDTIGVNHKQATECSRALEKWNNKCCGHKKTVPPIKRRVKNSRGMRVTHTSRTVTVTEDHYQYSRTHSQRQVDFEDTYYSDSEEDEYFFNNNRYQLSR